MPEQQSYANHTRYYPLFHFLLTPILVINLVWQIVLLWQEQTWDRAESLLLAVGLIILSLAARLQALRVQDRLIRLEERLRLQKLLPPELAARAGDLRTGQLIALRFASDAELPLLVGQVLEGKLTTPKEIKMAVNDWRADYLRV
ncbi:MAG: DUF6526 family protein [Pyrinomonadaceae bacterium]